MRLKIVTMRPQEVVILLKKVSPAGWNMNGKQLAEALGISQAEISDSLERSRLSGLIDTSKNRVNTLALKDFLIYGLRYSFPIVPAGVVRGMPTSISASPLNERIVNNGDSFVWPCSNGSSRGQAVQPLYPSVPQASEKDPDFYKLMVIADTFRFGRVRERDIATEELEKYFLNYVKQQ